MNSSYNPYAVGSVSEAPMETRTDFVRKTYLHLAGAIGAFALIETLLIQMGFGRIALQLLGASRFSWLIVLGAFMGVSWIANKWANNGASKSTQYAGLVLYTLAEAVIFLPLIMMATLYDPAAIGKAGVVTGFMVLGLTAIAFTTKKDFTFLGGFLKVGFLIALGVILAGVFMPGLMSGMGIWFSLAMVLLASGSILYNTSAIMYHYAPGQHVAASLSLFASVALLFWYVLQLFMSRD
ncbi:Bax inhibitor-1 family protein [Luteolibacter sp. GHJ8]|jgi:FtsH-binding integral membrane protein|uniref:Bax inhibitor-1 family protein n=1 Tax=Luteolibacter rhizosphaerae TaxID=2989719 RepID=A0ABT3G0R5_9BACT|nr:Bax inhibitor-1 family protein [Luteolibacter rhizosphaerae]MCW1913423.1 Bax inhibitor-1 family protein [Luteolibacter rhizosphaerae]